MPHVVTEACVNHKYQDCVAVCPVDAFREMPTYLIIDPDECIDCGVCEPECPPEAILPDSEEGAEDWVEFNRKFSELWPNITQMKDAMQDAEKYADEEDKLNLYFSEKPGEGD